jgi:hypothetical protein
VYTLDAALLSEIGCEFTHGFSPYIASVPSIAELLIPDRS